MRMPVPVEYYLGLAITLFIIGALGVLIRRNALIIFMSVELMLNAANLACVSFGLLWEQPSGEILVVFFI
jgi:NADH-quinone oxidoreductase subunit K